MRDASKTRLPVAPGGPSGTGGWTRALVEGLALGEAQAVSAALASARDEAAIAGVAAAAADRGEHLTGSATARERPALACRAGCGACCIAKVLVSAPEVLRIAAHLRATRSADELARIAARVEEARAKTAGLDRTARLEARVPCPLLEDESCSVHAVRPLVCRGWTSFDARACEAHFAAPQDAPAPPTWGPGYEIANALLAGVLRGCADAGLDGAPLELVAALAIALERPNAAERWRAGMPVFARARDAEWLARDA